MKKIAAMLFVVALLYGCRKNNSSTPTTGTGDGTATPTAKGTPLGSPVTQQIDQNGGSILSDDGTLEIVFPAGALKAATNIGIQSISNFCPDSLLNAYRLTPDGLTFNKKPTLIIHYPDSVLEGTYADLLGIAFQDTTGLWHAMRNTVIDSIHKTLSVAMPHFSDWAFFSRLRIRPGSAKVKVGKTLELGLYITPIVPDPNDTSDDLLAAPQPKAHLSNWSVNGIFSGNDAIGNIAQETSDGKYALYGAPAEVPSPATVAVSAEAAFKNAGSGKRLLVSNVTIYDQRYDIKITYDGLVGIANEFSMHDEATYSVVLKKAGGDITNIRNQQVVFKQVLSTKPCTSQAFTTDGPINVVSPVGVTVSANNIVTVSFPGTVKTVYSIGVSCPGAPVQTTVYDLAQINGSVTFPKSTAIQAQIVTPGKDATITYTITPVDK